MSEFQLLWLSGLNVGWIAFCSAVGFIVSFTFYSFTSAQAKYAGMFVTVLSVLLFVGCLLVPDADTLKKLRETQDQHCPKAPDSIVLPTPKKPLL